MQLVHYPLFARVGAASFPAYEAAHQVRITWIVAPLMIVELAAAAWLAFRPPPGIPPAAAWTGLALALIAWAVTGLVSAPLHGVLAGGFDAGAHRALVTTNWIRTAAWTGRAGLALWMASRLAR
jgi:hypothetical protein